MLPLKENLSLTQGTTLAKVVRWESPDIVYKTIQGITNTAPAVISVSGAHGVPAGWRVAITGGAGMTQINARYNPPRTSDYHRTTNNTTSTLELNDVDATDFGVYTANSAQLRYFAPVNLTGYTARMQFRASVGATAYLVELTTTGCTVQGSAPTTNPATDGIVLDTTYSTITLNLSAATLAALTWSTGVYDLELVSAAGVATKLLSGNVTLTKEVTR